MADTIQSPPASTGYEIYRTSTAPSLDETAHMEVTGMNPEFQAGITKALEAGFAEGNIELWMVPVALMGLFGAQLNLQARLQSAWVLVPFAMFFALFALAMFGVFELKLPHAISSRLDRIAGRTEGGSLWGAAVLGVVGAGGLNGGFNFGRNEISGLSFNYLKVTSRDL